VAAGALTKLPEIRLRRLEKSFARAPAVGGIACELRLRRGPDGRVLPPFPGRRTAGPSSGCFVPPRPSPPLGNREVVSESLPIAEGACRSRGSGRPRARCGRAKAAGRGGFRDRRPALAFPVRRPARSERGRAYGHAWSATLRLLGREPISVSWRRVTWRTWGQCPGAQSPNALWQR
jgi:hypothetical protein